MAWLLRRRQRISWLLLLAAAWVAALVVTMGWVSLWPVRSEADATTVRFDGTSAEPVSLALGNTHACALLNDGTVWCWGGNSGGQLDIAGPNWGSPFHARATPEPVPGITGATAIAASTHLTCVIAAGRVLCWGTNVWYSGERCDDPRTSGQSGVCSGGTSEQPGIGFTFGRSDTALEAVLSQNCEPQGDWPAACDPLPAVIGASSLSMSDQHGCVVADRRVWCWGVDNDGELGAGAQPDSADWMIPRIGWGNSVTGFDTALAVSTGPNATCALLAPESGAVRRRIDCWGTSAYEAFGLHVPVDTSAPFDVPAKADPPVFPVDPWPLCGPDPTAADAPTGCDHFVKSPALVSFGPLNTQIPAGVPDPVTAVSSAWDSSCAVAAGSAWCWGLVLGGPPAKLEAMEVPHRVTGLINVSSIAASGWSACAIANGEVRCWGLSSSGQLGVPYAPGVLDLLALGSLVALLLVAGAGGFAAVRIYQGEMRRRASFAFGPDARIRPVSAGTFRLLLAILATTAVYGWIFVTEGGDSAPYHYPFALPAAAGAGAVLALAQGAASRQVRRRRSLAIGALAVLAVVAVALGWIVPTLVPLIAGSLPQPVAASQLPELMLAAPVSLVGLLIFYLPPVDPLLVRDFGVQYREARTARRQLSLLLHPWRFLSTRAAERERTRLAAELHAGVLPGLYRSLKEVEGGGSVERQALDLREAVEEVEGMLARRRSIVLEEVGLLGAVEWLAERTEERSTVTVEIDVEDPGAAARPPRAVERAAFRVAQLALDNCARHAPGATATVRLAIASAHVTLVVSDDGPGLTQTPADAVKAGRNGLADMEDVARSCGARLSVASSDPVAERPGVTVTFEWRA